MSSLEGFIQFKTVVLHLSAYDVVSLMINVLRGLSEQVRIVLKEEIESTGGNFEVESTLSSA